jgi:Zn-dependent protease
MLGMGIILAFIFSADNQFPMKVLVGIGYGFLIIFSIFCHGIGGVISSRMVNAPVSSIIVTATVSVMQFDDEGEVSSRVHIGRSLGSPIFNLLAGLIAIVIYLFVAHNQFIIFFGWVNIIFGVFTLLPIPSLDGAVIFRELWKRKR